MTGVNQPPTGADTQGVEVRDWPDQYEVVEAFERGPLTRVRHKTLRGHAWGFAYPELATAVCAALAKQSKSRAKGAK